MKIHDCPESLKHEVDYANYDPQKDDELIEKHKIDLKTWLIEMGYDGPETGGILREQIADGYAMYMLADKGRGSILVHLPYADAYHSQNVEFLPRSEVVRRIKSSAKIHAIFGSQ